MASLYIITSGFDPLVDDMYDIYCPSPSRKDVVLPKLPNAELDYTRRWSFSHLNISKCSSQRSKTILGKTKIL